MSSASRAVAMDVDSDFETATSLSDTSPEKSISIFKQIIHADDPRGEMVKVKEQSIYELGSLLAKLGRLADLKALVVDVRGFFSSIPKGKTAKIVRTLIDLVGEVPNSEVAQAELCRESIAWCIKEKRTFLKQRIQARLANLLLQMKQYKEAIKLITKLVRDVKKIDDKLLMVEIELIESRVHWSLQNLPKAKGALTAARSAANSIYCPPLLQCEIDIQSGIITAEERDFKTAFSYFYEAFEGYNTQNQKSNAVRCLKYMLLMKVMTDSPSDVYSLINGKAGLKYAGVEVEAMRAIADAHKERSIHAFEAAHKKYKEQVVDDPIVFSHLNTLYESLLESNLLRIIEPFSRVQIAHVAELINLPKHQVESKLSEMVLDKKLHGILDQGAGDLILFDETQHDRTFEASIETIKELSGVVDNLSKMATLSS